MRFWDKLLTLRQIKFQKTLPVFCSYSVISFRVIMFGFIHISVHRKQVEATKYYSSPSLSLVSTLYQRKFSLNMVFSQSCGLFKGTFLERNQCFPQNSVRLWQFIMKLGQKLDYRGTNYTMVGRHSL